VIESPEERVKAFIVDWYVQWSIAEAEMGDNVDFGYWKSLISEVDRTHFAAGSSSRSGSSFSQQAEFDPSVEKITESEIQPGSALVFAEGHTVSKKIKTHHVFRLEKDSDNEWKIVTITTLFRPPRNLVVDADKHAGILALSSSDAAFMKRESYLNLNENTLFQADRSVEVANIPNGIVTLEQIGKIRISSGVIGILDFGYGIYNFKPLQRKVEPGDYRVETVTVEGRVAGIRVKFSENGKSEKWYAANTETGNGNYGVDAGNLAIFDVASLMKLSEIEKEQIFDNWSSSNKPAIVSMTGEDDCVITPSGRGDGVYPAFWGVSKQDEVTSLYVDFMILVEESASGVFESV